MFANSPAASLPRLALALAAIACVPWTTAQDRLPAGAKLDAYLTGVVRDTRIPGIVALVVDEDRVVYTGAFGRQNPLPACRWRPIRSSASRR